MWALKIIPAMVTYWLWTCTLAPTHVIDIVGVTTLTVEAPPTWPTITVTKTIGVPATAIDHAPPTTTSTPLPLASRPTLDPYNFSSSTESSSFDETPIIVLVLQECASILSPLEVPQYSIVDFIKFTLFAIAGVCGLLHFPLHLHIHRVRKLVEHVRQLTINRIVRSFKQICECVHYALWELGHMSILFGLIAGFCGYCTFQTSFRFIVGYAFLMASFLKWQSFKQGGLRSVRLVVRSADAVRRGVLHCAATVKNWVAGQAIEWYEERINIQRIDKIFERPIAEIWIGECLFPDLSITVPNEPTFFKIVKAMVTDLFFLAWNLLAVLVKLRRSSLMRFSPHTKEALAAVAAIIFGADEDDLLWTTLMKVFKYILELIRMALDAIYELAKEGFALALPKIQAALLCLRCKLVGQESAEAPPAQPQVIVKHKDSPNSRELGIKCVGYRQTIVELASDVNYLRLLLCSVLNAHHNMVNGKKPNALDADHPFQPSLIEFRFVPDAKTGLYMGYKEHTRRRDHDLGKEYRLNLRNFAMDLEREPARISTILRRHKNLPGRAPDGFDPFLKDHWVFQGAIPGLNIPPYNETNNPFDISAKRPRPVIRPESFFGPQIEDFAARGQLAQWGAVGVDGDVFVDGKPPKRNPFPHEELCKFKAEVMLGRQPSKKTIRWGTFDRAIRGYAVDPCPAGEPRDRDFPVYRNFA